MQILLYCSRKAPSIISRYEAIETYINYSGGPKSVIANSIFGIRASQMDFSDYSLVFTPTQISDEIRQRFPQTNFYAPRVMSRAEQLVMMQDAGYPVMNWALVKDTESLKALFKNWKTDKVILKKSFTGNGYGFFVLSSNQPKFLNIEEGDIVCEEVNPSNGDVYKAEIFNGELIVGWVLRKKPFSQRLRSDTKHVQDKGYRDLEPYTKSNMVRELFTFPPEEAAKIKALSLYLTQHKLGYIALDLMKSPDGSFKAIEFNVIPATWWTEQFNFVRTELAKAIYALC
jgi:hypothetical protein